MRPLAVCLAGPTAAGKSAAALALAAELPLEIISVDSAQVYRGMDIGTAKPSAAERARVPHHLIDILEPTQAYSAARFVADAHRLIVEVRGRGRLPLLVGGTMLYFKALAEGLDDMPKANAAVRAAIASEAAERGWPEMHAELARIDRIARDRLRMPVRHRSPAQPPDLERALDALGIGRCQARRGLRVDECELGMQRRPAAPGGVGVEFGTHGGIGCRHGRQPAR